MRAPTMASQATVTDRIGRTPPEARVLEQRAPGHPTVSRVVWLVALAAGCGGSPPSPPAPMVAETSIVTHYGREPSDTLRYRERTDATVQVEGPQGPIDVRSEHEASIAITFGPGDHLTAWYETLHLRQQGPGPQNQQPATDAVLRQPFHMTFSGFGKLNLISTPTFPAAIAALTDLTHQFDDFFISLPAGPLTVGTEWADTTSSTTSARPADSYSARHVRRYRVEGDTVLDGRPALTIAVRHAMEARASSRIEGQPLTAHIRLAGEETGLAIFSPEAGLLLARSKTGRLTGELEVRGGAQPVVLPQRYQYTSSIEMQR